MIAHCFLTMMVFESTAFWNLRMSGCIVRSSISTFLTSMPRRWPALSNPTWPLADMTRLGAVMPREARAKFR